MSEQTKLDKFFHNFLIYFALWAYALIAILYGARDIYRAIENDVNYLVPTAILSSLLILLGLFAIKVRFDLAAFRARGPKELVAICFAVVIIMLLYELMLYIYDDYIDSDRIFAAFIFVCFGISTMRYYRAKAALFTK